MNKLFECKVKYHKQDNNGLLKKVNEKYLIESCGYAECESLIIENICQFISSEYDISSLKKVNYSEIIGSGDKFFDCKLIFICLDENSGKERKTNVKILVRANEIKEVIPIIDESMKESVSDYTSVLIKETDIIDIFKYKP